MNGHKIVVNFVTGKLFDEIVDSLVVSMGFSDLQIGYLRHVKHIPFLQRDPRTEYLFKKLDVHCRFMSILRNDVSVYVKDALEETLRLVIPMHRLFVPVCLSRYYFASVN